MFLDHETITAITRNIPPLSLENISKRHVRILSILKQEKDGAVLPKLIIHIERAYNKKYALGDIESHLRDLHENDYIKHCAYEGRSWYTITGAGESFLETVTTAHPEKLLSSLTPSPSCLIVA